MTEFSFLGELSLQAPKRSKSGYAKFASSVKWFICI